MGKGTQQRQLHRANAVILGLDKVVLGDNIYKGYFTPKSVAKRYFNGRPRYHPFVIEKIRDFLALEDSLFLTLDVGCGTGFSSIALGKISAKVIGCDLSADAKICGKLSRG